MDSTLRSALCRQLAAALFGAAVFAAIAADPKASRFYEDALVRFEGKDFKGAIVQLKNALQIDRKMLPVQVLLGRALLANDELSAAEAAFDEALRLGVNRAEIVIPMAEAVTLKGRPDVLLSDPKFDHNGLPPSVKARLLMLKAAAASDVGSTREALKLVDDSRAVEPGGADSWAAEVPIRIRARQLVEAKVAADKAVALDGKSPKAAYQQATVAHLTGDAKNALAMYTRTLSLKPDHIDALVARAGLLVDLGRFPEATVDIKAARAADPKDPRSAYLSALMAERAGNTAEVRKALAEVTALLDPVPVERLRYRSQLLTLGGLAHFGLDEYSKAKAYLEMAVRQDSDSPLSKLLARVYLRERAQDKAIEALELYLHRHSNDRQALLMLASAHLAQGRYSRAAQLSAEALKQADDPSMRAVLGLSLVGSGKLAPGAAELEASLNKDPDQIQAGVTLTGLYIASNQWAKAVATADALVKRQPKNPGLVHLLGSALAAKGDVDGARRAFEQASSLDPTFYEPQISAAHLDAQQKAYDSALKRLEAVLAKDNKNVGAALEVAHIYDDTGRADDALRWFQRANDLSGPKLAAGVDLVEFHLRRGRPDLARETMKSLQSRAPEAFVVLYTQARVQLANRELPEAKSTLGRATSLVAYDAAALVQLANLQIQAGDVPGAASALDKALTVNPDHLVARAMRSNVYVMQGEPAKAEQLARSVMTTDPRSGLGYALLGDLARARNQMPAAIDAYRRAHQSEHSSLSLLRLFSALESTQPQAAVTLANQWLKERPSDVMVWRALADSQARAGNMAAAKVAYENVLKSTPDDAEVLNNLAIVLVTLRDAQAVRVSERAMALKPAAAYIVGTAGWAAFHSNQPDRALQLLRDALLRDPTNPNTRYFLGVVLAQAGRKSEARTELESALRSGAALAYAKEASDLLQTLK